MYIFIYIYIYIDICKHIIYICVCVCPCACVCVLVMLAIIGRVGLSGLSSFASIGHRNTTIFDTRKTLCLKEPRC